MRVFSRFAAVAVAASAALPPAAFAQTPPCGHWSDGFAISELGGRIQASVIFDDGTGPALYVAGEFGNERFPGRRGIAKWNGSAWVSVGGGLDGPGWALTVFDDDGPGPHAPALYVAGTFAHAGPVPAASIAKWDGRAWSPLAQGIAGTVYALKGHDDGRGPALYAGGDFQQAGSAFVSSLAVFRNGEWDDVGGGVTLGNFSGYVEALESFGGALYVGGFFDVAGNVVANAIAQWRDGSFTALAEGISYGGFNAQVSRLLAVDLPSTGGPALIVAGFMSDAGNVPSGPVVRWTGSAWVSMNSLSTSNDAPNALAVYNDGSGPALYVGGILPPGSGISKWTGSDWSLVGEIPKLTGVPLGIDALTALPNGKLFAGGMYTRVGGVAVPQAATFQAGQWSPLGPWGLGLDGPVYALGAYDLGDGQKLYAAGAFRLAGGVPAAGVARLAPGSTHWEALATSMSPSFSAIRSMTVFDSGTGPTLYVGGSFTDINGVPAANVARWRPSTGWRAAGAGLSELNNQVFGNVYALAVHREPSGPESGALFATGLFQFTGVAPITNVARFNGTSWSSVGAGAGPDGTGGACLASIDDDGPGGAPPKLYFGGVFLPIASWNGQTWTPDPSTPSATVLSFLGRFDLGHGSNLYAGGDFTFPFGGSVAVLKPSGWEELGVSPRFPFGAGSGGSASDASVKAMLTFDEGAQTGLYMTGIFGELNFEGYRNVARWDGSDWTGLGAGLASRFPGPDGRGSAMIAFDDGSGPALFVGGKFERYYNDRFDRDWHAAYNLAKWIPCRTTPPCRADYNADGRVDPDDLADFITCYFSQPPCPPTDFNADGAIDPDDLADFISNYFNNC